MTETQAPYFSPQPKPEKPNRNSDYLKWIRRQPCGKSKLPGPCEAHHVRRSYWGAGGSQKPHDYVTVPRRTEYHKPEYDGEERRICREIITMQLKYIEEKYGVGESELAYRKIIETIMNHIESKRR
uniref:Uncharacterized protein n=1 Tax=viral metagenome TaxID=1070528 RepID=A0A6H1ZP20_9ZZZZ